MSGLLLAQRLKAEPATKDIVLVAVTAFSGPDASAIALAAGCVDFIRKPVDPLSIATTILGHVSAGAPL